MQDTSSTAGTPRRGFAYVLMAHVDPDVVLARARRVLELSPGAHVLVRHSGATGFARLGPAPAPGVEVFRSGTTMRWGTFSVVQGVVEAVAEAATRWQPTHTVVVSGQDHPVHDLAHWEESVRSAGTDALLNTDTQHYDDRWTRCWHALPDTPLLPDRVLWLLARRLPRHRLHRAGGRTWFTSHRRGSVWSPLPYRKGSLWMTVSAAAADRLVAAVRDPALVDWFSHQLLPDEAFAHSVLARATGLRIRTGPTTTAFFPPEAMAHPRVLTADDVGAVTAGSAPFARKVLPGVSDAFVRAVDAAVDVERAAHLQRH